LKLVDVAGKGGNYFLNVGPTAEGIIPPVCAKSLKEIGEWLSINGESIYETTASPFNYLSWGSATRRGNKIYLHVNKWPADGRLIVPIKSGVQKAYLLQDADNSLKIKRSKERVVINLPRFAPDKIVSVVVVEIEGEPDVFPMLTLNKKAMASSELKEENSVMKLFDNNPKSIWCGAKGSDSAFVEIDLEKLEPVAGFAFAEPYRLWNNKTQGFKLEYKNGDTWEMISSGKTKGVGYEENFTPIKARYVRLTISNKEESPRLNEWTLRRAE
jgi:alpha-L-fucosidase